MGNLKNKVYARNPHTLDDLHKLIRKQTQLQKNQWLCIELLLLLFQKSVDVGGGYFSKSAVVSYIVFMLILLFSMSCKDKVKYCPAAPLSHTKGSVCQQRLLLRERERERLTDHAYSVLKTLNKM